MDTETINHVVCYITKHARKTVLQDEPILILVDGHSSRDGVEWTDTCARLNIAAVKLPENTTHMLQPCEQRTNKVFQQEIRRTRDLLLNISHFVLGSRTVAHGLSLHVIFG